MPNWLDRPDEEAIEPDHLDASPQFHDLTVVPSAHGTVSAVASLTGHGRAKPVVKELRQTAVFETEYEAPDGLRWVELEMRENGLLTDFELHNSTPDEE